MLHIQGDLQAVFDALYELGVIEPVLKMDWNAHLREIETGSAALENAIRLVNRCAHDRAALAAELKQLDSKALEILAMEVAREYAGFQTTHDLH